MDVYQAIICYNHLRMHVSPIIMLQCLNSYSAMCQFYLNKAERKLFKNKLHILEIRIMNIIQGYITTNTIEH